MNVEIDFTIKYLHTVIFTQDFCTCIAHLCKFFFMQHYATSSHKSLLD